MAINPLCVQCIYAIGDNNCLILYGENKTKTATWFENDSTIEG